MHEEATTEIDIQDDCILPDFDWLDVIDQQSKWTSLCEQRSTLQSQIVCATHACAVYIETLTDCVYGP